MGGSQWVRTEFGMAKRFLLVFAALVVMGLAPRMALAVTLEEEISLGKKIDAQIMKENRLYSDDAAQKEMQEYGQKLAKNVSRPQIPYHFKILRDDQFNAFSIPGGYVYFTDRLWRVLRKDERIGVIGHEITHVDHRHAIDAMLKQQRREILLSVLLIATKAGDLMGNVAGMAEQMYTLKYSRGDEEQADNGSVDLCQKANYNPAGILLAMYKIGRFEAESGGAPPKIFSDHPPTKERLQYLTQLLIKRGITPPPATVQTAPVQNKVGSVASVNGDTMTFGSTKPLQVGDIAWVMHDGWDFYYEKRAAVPFARAVVTQGGQYVTATVKLMPTTKQFSVAKGMDVTSVPVPPVENKVGLLKAVSKLGGIGRLSLDKGPHAYDRLLAVQPVWNKDNTQLVNDNVGYLVVTNPASDTGYVGRQNPKFSYAPMEANSALIRIDDPDQQRWIGPVISIGRSGGTIEVSTKRKLDTSKTYEVAYPIWVAEEAYRKRVVATAKFDSAGAKIILRVSQFSPGCSMDDLQNGFDIYEQSKQAK